MSTTNQKLKTQEKKHLNTIKEKLFEKKMSIFIGTGFSKNANYWYPSWDELLEPLIIEMYEEDYLTWKSKNFKNEEENCSKFNSIKFLNLKK